MIKENKIDIGNKRAFTKIIWAYGECITMTSMTLAEVDVKGTHDNYCSVN